MQAQLQLTFKLSCQGEVEGGRAADIGQPSGILPAAGLHVQSSRLVWLARSLKQPCCALQATCANGELAAVCTFCVACSCCWLLEFLYKAAALSGLPEASTGPAALCKQPVHTESQQTGVPFHGMTMRSLPCQSAECLDCLPDADLD